MDFDDEDLTRFHLTNSKGTFFYVSIDHTRVPKLTLAHLNKLKQIQAVRNVEELKRQELVTIMYGAPPEEPGASPF